MNKSGIFSIETMKLLGLLVHECIVLRDELPADLGGNNIGMNGGCRIVRRCCRSGHDFIKMKAINDGWQVERDRKANDQ